LDFDPAVAGRQCLLLYPESNRFFENYTVKLSSRLVDKTIKRNTLRITLWSFIMLEQCFVVAIGGFFGAIARFTLSIQVQNRFKSFFPYGTLFVNVLGCFLMGLMFGLISKTDFVGLNMQNMIDTGFIGAFTTFSTFSYETFSLIRENEIFLALLNIGIQVILGLLAVWLGCFLVF
jgi:fluoride exporter